MSSKARQQTVKKAAAKRAASKTVKKVAKKATATPTAKKAAVKTPVAKPAAGKKKAAKKAVAVKTAAQKAAAKKATAARKTTAEDQQKPLASLSQLPKPKKSKPAPAIEIGPAELEFIDAIDKYKLEYGRPFPSWSEILYVLRGLGYERS